VYHREWSDQAEEQTVLQVASDGRFAGFVAVSDRIRESTAEAIEQIMGKSLHKSISQLKVGAEIYRAEVASLLQSVVGKGIAE
jgi:hypothetical protein